MLETVILDATLSKKEHAEAIKALEGRLAVLQRELRQADAPVLVVFEGWDAAGKGSTIGRIVHGLDPRGFKVFHIEPASDTDQLYPPMRRFWQLLPARGAITFFNHSWYRQVLDEPLDQAPPPDQRAAAYRRIRVFERQMTDDGALIVKFFLHISKKEQARRFKALAADPAFAWKVGPAEKHRHEQYDAVAGLIEDLLRETSTATAPWTLVAATDSRFRDVQVAETLASAFEQALARTPCPHEPPAAPPRRIGVLDTVDLTLSAGKRAYRKELPRLQDDLRRLQHVCYLERRPVVLVFEGWDAGGKGGAIRRLISRLDPRGYEVIPIGAPEGEEKRKHHLWRFWRALRKAGHITIFDRSWYGRVLVERVEGFARPDEWARAYREINEFEAELEEAGAVICKFWMHISKKEQLRRFESRQNTPEKQWKITEEDWRNREQWDAYYEAVSDMIEKTSTVQAPWTVVEGDDKKYARLRVLRVVIERLAAALPDTTP